MEQIATGSGIATVEHRSLQLTGIGKRYGNAAVLQDIDLLVEPGRVHGLLGENGAGKSTLMRILAGVIQPDAGSMELGGQPFQPQNPRQALAAGAALISQEISLVPAMSVLENVFLGSWSNRGGLRTARPDRARFTALIRRTGFEVDPDRPVRDLPQAAQQQVEILRALARDSAIIAMDEPTALLTRDESDRLLELIRSLADEGRAVVLISHFLDEILGVADTVTVLRDGKRVFTGPAAEQTPDSLVKHMVGRQVDMLYPDPAPVPADSPEVLRLDQVSSAFLSEVSLTVRRGEIVGLAGLVGAGRSETLMAAFGADRITAGRAEIVTDGGTAQIRSCHQAVRTGVALIPESRKEQGLVLVRSLRENLALASLGNRQRAGVIQTKKERSMAADLIDRVDVRGSDLSGSIWKFSGGNQQKALFGKWLAISPAVLLVDEPTRGVDIAAKVQIHKMLVELAAQGLAVLLVSSEIEEVLALSHRVLVMRHGRIVAEFPRGADRERVMIAAFGAESTDPTAVSNSLSHSTSAHSDSASNDPADTVQEQS